MPIEKKRKTLSWHARIGLIPCRAVSFNPHFSVVGVWCYPIPSRWNHPPRQVAKTNLSAKREGRRRVITTLFMGPLFFSPAISSPLTVAREKISVSSELLPPFTASKKEGFRSVWVDCKRKKSFPNTLSDGRKEGCFACPVFFFLYKKKRIHFSNLYCFLFSFRFLQVRAIIRCWVQSGRFGLIEMGPRLLQGWKKWESDVWKQKKRMEIQKQREITVGGHAMPRYQTGKGFRFFGDLNLSFKGLAALKINKEKQ